MFLREKIASISSDKAVIELGDMLNHAQVSINWYGQRIITVDGYEGSAKINELASKFLSAVALQRDANANLQERFDYYVLWERFQQLYANSDLELNKTWLFKHLVPFLEFRPYCRMWTGNPKSVICAIEPLSNKKYIFEYDRHVFKELWPETEPFSKSWVRRDEYWSEKWTASKELVEKTLYAK